MDEDKLSDRDKRVLSFELRHLAHNGAKEEAIRVEFGLSAARYYQLVNELIDWPEALRNDPQLVYGLRRRREERRHARASRSFATAASPQPAGRRNGG